MRLDLVTFLVEDYDDAIAFFTGALGFELVSEEVTTAGPAGSGGSKRWVVVRPPSGGAGLLLALATGAEQRAGIGRQTGGRVGWFLGVDDVAVEHARLRAAGVEFAEEPRVEAYGTVAVFLDLFGGRWDLLGP